MGSSEVGTLPYATATDAQLSALVFVILLPLLVVRDLFGLIREARAARIRVLYARER